MTLADFELSNSALRPVTGSPEDGLLSQFATNLAHAKSQRRQEIIDVLC